MTPSTQTKPHLASTSTSTVAKTKHFMVQILVARAGGVVTLNGSAEILGVSHISIPRRGRPWWKFWARELAMVVAYGIPVVERFREEV